MNRVGQLGRGESVWLAWFLCRLVDDFGSWRAAAATTSRALGRRGAALGWQHALAGPVWDMWYTRAFPAGPATGYAPN